MNENRIRLGMHGSALAQALQALDLSRDISLHIVQTAGDRDQTQPLSDVSGQGVFTSEIERAAWFNRKTPREASRQETRDGRKQEAVG